MQVHELRQMEDELHENFFSYGRGKWLTGFILKAWGIDKADLPKLQLG